MGLGKFRKILTELSGQDMPIFSFPDHNLCKCQVILTKLGTCVDIKEIWFGIANGQISLKLSVCDRIMAGYYSVTFLFSLIMLHTNSHHAIIKHFYTLTLKVLITTAEDDILIWLSVNPGPAEPGYVLPLQTV